MAYRIKQYTKNQAKKHGVSVKPSKVKGKKIDVFNKEGAKIASVGAIGYNDYPTFMELEKKGKVPKGTAAKRRRHTKRHDKTEKRGTNGWYADKLLW